MANEALFKKLKLDMVCQQFDAAKKVLLGADEFDDLFEGEEEFDWAAFIRNVIPCMPVLNWIGEHGILWTLVTSDYCTELLGEKSHEY